MREIRFRVWNNDKNKMIFGPTDDNRSSSWVFSIHECFGCPIMQYTGLRDMYGKEIYEGDILSSALLMGACEVAYKPSNFVVRRKDWSQDYLLSDINLFKHEVIGNIHENPELLEVR